MPAAINSQQIVIGLDIGNVRIGVARGLLGIGIANPVTTLLNGPDVIAEIQRLVVEEQAQAIIIGLPRNLNGDDTDQTRTVRAFAETITATCGLPVHLQDEALTSRHARAELERRGKPYRKADIDSLAASLIVEDYLRESSGVSRG